MIPVNGFIIIIQTYNNLNTLYCKMYRNFGGKPFIFFAIKLQSEVY